MSSSLMSFQKNEVELKYRDLMFRFETILKARSEGEALDESFAVTIGINPMRGFLDEFKKKKKENSDFVKGERNHKIKRIRRKKPASQNQMVVSLLY